MLLLPCMCLLLLLLSLRAELQLLLQLASEAALFLEALLVQDCEVGGKERESRSDRPAAAGLLVGTYV